MFSNLKVTRKEILHVQVSPSQSTCDIERLGMKKQLHFFTVQMREFVTELSNLSQGDWPSPTMKHAETFLNHRPKLVFRFVGDDVRGFHTTRFPLHFSNRATARSV